MKDALKLALEALESWHKGFPDLMQDIDKEAITAIKEALAQDAQSSSQEKKMTASMLVENGYISFAAKILADGTYDLYTCTPPRGLEPL